MMAIDLQGGVFTLYCIYDINLFTIILDKGDDHPFNVGN